MDCVRDVVQSGVMSYGTVPAPPSPAPYVPQQKSWFSRNWKWFIPVVVLVPALLLVLFVGAIMSLVFGMMKSSEPYKHGMAVMMSNPQAIQSLGAPVKAGRLVSGNINTTDSSGDADLSIPVRGSLRSGKLYVIAKKSVGVWHYEKIQLWIDGQSSGLDLLHDSSVPAEER